MSLREAARRIASLSGYPLPHKDRKLAIERAAERLPAGGGSGRGGQVEEWEEVAARLDFSRLHKARPRDLRRAISDIWVDRSLDAQASSVVDYGLAALRKTYDRAIVLAYLRRFNPNHPSFDALAGAAGTAAERHDWPWLERGRTWHLWDPEEGPKRVGQALLQVEDPVALFAKVGLDGDLSHGAFTLDALDAACEEVAVARGADAERLGARLIALFDQLQVRALNARLAYALLSPWADASPHEEHRKRVGTLLVKLIGDPRLNETAWAALDLPKSLIATLQRWLTDTAVREFFKIVGRATDDPQQWAEREQFWLGYLNAGGITNAWFAFGTAAEQVAKTFVEQEGVGYGVITGDRQYADPGHSSLLMEIGDLRIAEWSHNGACRFWRADDRTAPVLYREKYFGYQLRAMNGGADFEYLTHHSNWQNKFARKVHQITGMPHPKHGSGYRW